ncbi:MAG: GDP-mannose 4,6-dehydratase [Acidobacteria bacterium]|nr:GDP-mannose 4,6-dehydratase [Acidobacteriota bacterium]
MSGRPQVVLVTGAAGFAGSHLIEQLSGSCDLVAWARSAPPPGIAGLARWTSVDLLDRDRVRREMGALRPAAVYHCAGAPHVGASWRDTAYPLAHNVLTTHHLLDALRRAGGGCRVLVTGSATVYAPSTKPLREDDPLAPTSPYALSKLAQEQLTLRSLAEDGLDVLLVRPFNHTGPRQRPDFAAPGMARQIALIERGALPPVIKVGNLDAARDLTDVRDVVRAYALLMERGVAGTVYNIASGVARPIRGVLDALVHRAQVRIDVSIDPERFRPQDTPVILGDASRLRATTGWTPLISFDRMLDDLLAYWRASTDAPPGR